VDFIALAFLLLPVVAAIWALVTLARIRAGQEELLDRIRLP
jgi:hypothetical protein